MTYAAIDRIEDMARQTARMASRRMHDESLQAVLMAAAAGVLLYAALQRLHHRSH